MNHFIWTLIWWNHTQKWNQEIILRKTILIILFRKQKEQQKVVLDFLVGYSGFYTHVPLRTQTVEYLVLFACSLHYLLRNQYKIENTLEKHYTHNQWRIFRGFPGFDPLHRIKKGIKVINNDTKLQRKRTLIYLYLYLYYINN
jgi:hypothetical protein